MLRQKAHESHRVVAERSQGVEQVHGSRVSPLPMTLRCWCPRADGSNMRLLRLARIHPSDASGPLPRSWRPSQPDANSYSTGTGRQRGRVAPRRCALSLRGRVADVSVTTCGGILRLWDSVLRPSSGPPNLTRPKKAARDHLPAVASPVARGKMIRACVFLWVVVYGVFRVAQNTP